jgi:hypothetical protein
MATHDYVIDNSTGANVRADINLVLQAILTNNSSSSAPSTTAAYMWWADTTTGILKIRNSANNAWVELLQLDGTLTLEDGSESAPALGFRNDLNTGIFAGGTDKFNITAGGVERLELGSETIFNETGADVDFRIEGDTQANLFYLDAGNNRIGIGTSSPSAKVYISETGSLTGGDINVNADGLVVDNSGGNTGLTFKTPNSANARIVFGDPEDNNRCQIIYNHSIDNLIFDVNGAERFRIDSSGNVGIGTTNPTQLLEIHGASNPAVLVKDTTNDCISYMFSQDSVATFGSASNHPVVFNVNNGEVIRIDTSGKVNVGGTTSDAKFVVIDSSNPDIAMRYNGTAGGHNTRLMFVDKRGAINAQVANVLISDGVGDATANLSFATANDGTLTTRMLIKNDGNTVIDSSDDFSHLGQFTSTHDGSRFGIAVHNTNGGGGSQTAIRFHRNDTDVGSISTTGSATAYNTSSDYRLKENAVAISDGITRLKTLKPYRFNWKSDPTTTVDGFFAHEVTAVPEAITGTKDEVALADDSLKNIKKDDPIYQQIDQAKLVPLLVAAVQELITKVETLEAA